MTTWRPNSPNARQPAANITRVQNQDARTLIEKYGRMAAPFFRIQINDKDNRTLFSSESAINESGYDLEGLVIYEAEYDETDCQASMIRLTMANPKMNLQDGIIFTEGNTIDLWMGYDGLEPDYMGRGFIVEISPTFEATDIPRFHVVAYDISHFMMEEGRGDIVPEGTAWYERKRVTTNTAPTQGNTNCGTSTNNQNGNATNQSNRNQGNQSAQERRGRSRGVTQSAPAGAPDSSTSSGNDNRTNPSANNNTATQENSRMEWVRWKQPRRGRNNGKVWKGKTDSEIVDAIFESYGIVPYTKASEESKQTVRTITVPINNGEDGEISSSVIPDTHEGSGQVSEGSTALGLRTHGIDPATHDATANPELNLLDMAVFERSIHEQENRCQPRETRIVREDRKVTQKNGTSDWDFVKELAKKRGYIVFTFFHYLSGKWIGYWGSDTNVPQQHTYTLKYAMGDDTSLARIKPTISLREQKTEIDMQYIDPRSGKEHLLRVAMDNISPVYSQIKRNASQANIEPLGDGPEITLNVFGRRTSVLADRNFDSPEDARDWLVSFWIRTARDFCRMEAQTIIGLPELRARQIHTINGIGRISGNFFITKTVHRMGSGHVYETRFNGFRTLNGKAFNNVEVETESTNLGEWAPPTEDTRTSFSR